MDHQQQLQQKKVQVIALDSTISYLRFIIEIKFRIQYGFAS